MAAYKMDSRKSGVMIYFDPMRKEADKLDDARLGQLFRAILNYADPDCGREPEFDDETLSHVWTFVSSIVIRDDKTYRAKSSNKKYAVFCRYAKEHGVQPIEREAWLALGEPTFTQWKESQNPTVAYSRMQADTDASNRMQADTGESVRMPISSSMSSSLSPSMSMSVSMSDAGAARPDGGAANADADASRDAEKPASGEIPTLEEVKRYCRQKDLRYIDPVYYYNYHEANGWTMKDGRRIVNWKAHILNWDAGDRARGRKGAPAAGERPNEVRKYAQELQEKLKKRK